jgi:WD40 repeat protein
MGARVMGGIFCVVFTMLWWLDTSATTGQEQQKAFRISTLTSDWGYYAAAFAPDDQCVAVIASKGSSDAQRLEVTQEIQVWDFRATKLVSKKFLSQKKMPRGMPYQPQISLYDYTDSGSMILMIRNGHLVLLDARTLDEIREIDLATGNWPQTSEDSPGLSFVKGVAVDKSGDRAVVLLQWGRGEGGELRVYNLDSGELVRGWDYASLRTNDRNRDFGGADISADGRQVAASLIPFVIGEGALRSSEHNVFVLDIDSGSTIAAINTRYPAGHVRFAPTNPPVLLTVSADNFDRQRSTKDAIKIWDPLNGKLLRELDTPPEGVHFQVQVSSDGRIVLGYTGLEKFRGRWWLGQEETGSIDYNQFTLWNLTTGKIIAASPHIPSSEAHRSFRLSPMGDVVLLYPDTVGAKTLTFYELQRLT